MRVDELKEFLSNKNCVLHNECIPDDVWRNQDEKNCYFLVKHDGNAKCSEDYWHYVLKAAKLK